MKITEIILNKNAEQFFMIENHSVLLSIGIKNNFPTAWFRVSTNPEDLQAKRLFTCFKNGDSSNLPFLRLSGQYAGTIVLDGEAYHYFDNWFSD